VRRAEGRAAFQFRDFRGKPSSASGFVSPVATPTQISAVAVALGNGSNARLMEQRVTQASVQVFAADPQNTAFDEAYATVDDGLIFVFQNTVGDIQTWRLPAPDAILFLADGETPVDPDSGAAAGSGALLISNIVTAILAAMNETSGTYVYARSYKEGVNRRRVTPLPLEEPSGTDLPGSGPGV
jgi:hypothetical protein